MVIRQLHVTSLFDLNQRHNDWLERQVEGANDVFQRAGIEFRSSNGCDVYAFKEGHCDIGACAVGKPPTNDQSELFGMTARSPSDEIAVLVAKVLTPWFAGGCAWHPDGQPGCIVTAREDVGSPKYKLAHELGHVLGLRHVDAADRLMCPSVGWTKLPPELSEGEVDHLTGAQQLRALEQGASLAVTDEQSFHEQTVFELRKIEPDFAPLMRHGEKLIPELLRVWDEIEDGEVKARAMYLLSQVDTSLRVDGSSDSKTKQVLRAAVIHKDALIRAALAYGLANCDEKFATPLFGDLEKDSDPCVLLALKLAKQAASALGKKGGQRPRDKG